MYSKRKNVVFITCIVVISIVLILLTINMEDLKTRVQENSTTTNANEEISKSADDILREEAINYGKKATDVGEILHKGKYKDRRDSYEVNDEFITEEYIFKNPTSFIEFEFIDYTELNDVTEYVEHLDWKNEMKFYLQDGCINRDGTLPTFEYYLKVKYADGEYGEEVFRQETKCVPVKLTVRYKNLLTESTNELTISNEHWTLALEYMDDNKLYLKDSVYSIWHYYIGVLEPIYISIPEERRKPNNAAYILQPGEEIVAELIYLIPECELNNAYFCTRWGGGDFRNFEAIDIRFIPFANLKKLSEK